MKNKSTTITMWKKVTASLAIASLFLNASCTTTGTQARVLSEPMSADLEAQVMKETGISGALVGALVGGVATGGLTYLAMVSSGASSEQALTGAAIAGTAGAVGGGVAGYQKGKKDGQKLVATAMTRDQVAKFIEGARVYNKHLAQTNSTLRTALQRAKTSKDKSTLALVKKESGNELKDLDKRIANRQQAINKAGWPTKSDKSKYASELAAAKAQRATLAKIVSEANDVVL